MFFSVSVFGQDDMYVHPKKTEKRQKVEEHKEPTDYYEVFDVTGKRIYLIRASFIPCCLDYYGLVLISHTKNGEKVCVMKHYIKEETDWLIGWEKLREREIEKNNQF